MSYNIDNISVIAADGFGIDEDVRDALLEAHGEEAPHGALMGALELSRGTRLAWCGEFSGRSYDLLIEKILPRFHGDADLVVCFEGGDSYDGLRLRDGKVTRHEVVMTLGAEKSDA